MRETTIWIIIITIEVAIFLTIDKRNEIKRDYKDAKMVETMKLKVDSMRVRNRDYFLLTLRLNDITNDYQSSRKAKEKDLEVVRLMKSLND